MNNFHLTLIFVLLTFTVINRISGASEDDDDDDEEEFTLKAIKNRPLPILTPEEEAYANSARLHIAKLEANYRPPGILQYDLKVRNRMEPKQAIMEAFAQFFGMMKLNITDTSANSFVVLPSKTLALNTERLFQVMDSLGLLQTTDVLDQLGVPTKFPEIVDQEEEEEEE